MVNESCFVAKMYKNPSHLKRSLDFVFLFCFLVQKLGSLS